MLAALGVIMYGFLMGLRRGASSCLALCIPSIAPAVLEQQGNWLGGIRVALWFNAPRIVMLTALGAGIGAGGYLAGSGLEAFGIGSGLWTASYILVGCMMVAYGTYVFAVANERMGRDQADAEVACGEMAHPLLSRLNWLLPRSRGGLALWGGIVSIACIGETVISLESIFVGLSSIGAGGPLAGALLGGTAFFMFALGASIPSMAFAGMGSGLADREKGMKRMLRFEMAAGILMMLFGMVVIVAALMVI